ncbi:MULTISPECIES: pentapeptide repeat-containing protein [Rhodococcus]|uniref:Pentapeptide repeat-containing protein n=1 Tax=Rhodococcus oxybenzonivorans TaxID=1990687 RepID=A0AAE5A9Q0_9NOCA|nr:MULTISPECIES: pentapeptide repeat-containing protein [Rhodococcus]MDV7242245.1 pentapeptide repeat-containing protein [Rhodococcus oxybenzonivorans]MDV7268746.1 pentapeptide repeat-containing protein [Rhodococcus oxybenzonivorans]MDV7276259.1 pentapeptide repeat-containing protein [Rhodococcus oxybenzonivorans]MDV7331733.1 pentapeptide repeat-containing protein [Rhodococcus oxybenzonivorans]MDV7343955.1 pentapeptide repeat-containing protein [Rhodococcus oxybenzonivorans]
MTADPAPQRRQDLRADCGSCFALCCTAFGFSRSVDFAEDKPAGAPCRHLGSEFSCTVHAGLRSRGFRGCTVFDCFGAGQAVSQRLFSGISWRERPDLQQRMFAAFKVMKQLHEMLWYLLEAQGRTYDPDAAHEARDLASVITALTRGGLPELLTVDMDALHSDVKAVLVDTSEEVRASYFAENGHLDKGLGPGADLVGKNLRARRLCGADLRGACLIAADLRESDLTAVDLLGADLRDARLEGADLSAALYVTQPQINAARGSGETRLPTGISAPAHWHSQ